MRIEKVVAAACVVLTGACAEAASDTSFHTAVAPAPPAGSMFLYPERIPARTTA